MAEPIGRVNGEYVYQSGIDSDTRDIARLKEEISELERILKGTTKYEEDYRDSVKEQILSKKAYLKRYENELKKLRQGVGRWE